MSVVDAIRRWTRPTPAYSVYSFAQEGEDRVLERFLQSRGGGHLARGFFVDVGAHHPQRFSTTYSLYLKGWRGISIDPTPGMAALFDRLRPGDVNLELAISLQTGDAILHRFADEALNTLDTARAAFLESVGIPVRERCTVKTATLADVIDTHGGCHVGVRPDLLNVDAEGRDLDVLRSNDWDRFRPTWVVVEVLKARTLEELARSAINAFLRKLGYRAVAKTFNTAFFESE